MSRNEPLPLDSVARYGNYGALQRRRSSSFLSFASVVLVRTKIDLPSEPSFTRNSGMYNAITGMGGSGQLNQTVAANATVALLATGSIFAVFVAPPVFDVSSLQRNTAKSNL